MHWQETGNSSYKNFSLLQVETQKPMHLSPGNAERYIANVNIATSLLSTLDIKIIFGTSPKYLR